MDPLTHRVAARFLEAAGNYPKFLLAALREALPSIMQEMALGTLRSCDYPDADSSKRTGVSANAYVEHAYAEIRRQVPRHLDAILSPFTSKHTLVVEKFIDSALQAVNRESTDPSVEHLNMSIHRTTLRMQFRLWYGWESDWNLAMWANAPDAHALCVAGLGQGVKSVQSYAIKDGDFGGAAYVWTVDYERPLDLADLIDRNIGPTIKKLLLHEWDRA